MEPPNGKPGPSAPSATSSFHSFALPIPTSYNPSRGDDSDEEWEYEYSTTETETYYLTLDLTTPFNTSRRLKGTHRGRGAYRTKWINPGLGRQKRQFGRASKHKVPETNPISSATPASFATPDAEANEEIEAEQERDEDVDMDAEDDEVEGGFAFPADLIDKLTKPTADEVAGEEIQILELHSENPVIVYRNQVFSCTWAENIGTELVFALRDPKQPLDTLRQLPDNVDLLAASSARLLGKAATLEPRGVASSPAEPAGKGKGRAGAESVTVETKKTGDARSQQVEFLERLTRVKERRGERDEVTMVAKQRITSGAWKALVSQKRDGEVGGLRGLMRMEGGDLERGRGGKRGKVRVTKVGKGVRRSGGTKARANVEGRGVVGGKVGRRVQEGASSLSTPTPARWGDLEEERGEEDDVEAQSGGEGDSGDEDGSEMEIDLIKC